MTMSRECFTCGYFGLDRDDTCFRCSPKNDCWCEDIPVVKNNVVDLQKRTDTAFWLRCPCGSTNWMMQVDAPVFNRFIRLVCSDCLMEAPIDFKIKKVVDESRESEGHDRRS